jgi:hypothetical protein
MDFLYFIQFQIIFEITNIKIIKWIENYIRSLKFVLLNNIMEFFPWNERYQQWSCIWNI